MKLNPGLTDYQVTQILADYFDDHKVYLVCSKHGDLKEYGVAGCGECSHLFWRRVCAKMPPHKRQESMERMEELVHKLVENEAALKQVNLLKHPDIKIGKS